MFEFSVSEAYRRISVVFTDESVRKHESAISDLAQSASVHDAVALTLLYLRRTVRPEDERRIRTRLNKHDRELPITGSDERIRILAGAALLDLLTVPKKSTSDIAWLALKVNPLPDHDPSPIDEVVPAAISYFYRESEAARTVSDIKPRRVVQKDIISLGNIDPSKSAADVSQKLQSVGKNVEARLKTLEDQNGAIWDRQRILLEENDILWYLLGGKCESRYLTLDVESSAGSLGIMVAADLADVTRLLPPIRNFPHVIRRQIRRFGGQPDICVRPCDALSHVPGELAERFGRLTKDTVVLSICPTLASTMTESPEELTLVSFAERMYLELLLARELMSDDE